MYPTKRTRFFSVKNAQFIRLFVYSVLYGTISLWLLCILLRSGDIQPNPTHFTERSSSLIDLFILRNPANVLYSGVIDPFIPDQIRYHCPILIPLIFLRPKPKIIKRKIWNYELADYNRYRNLLSLYTTQRKY